VGYTVDDDALMTMSETAEFLRVSRWTVFRLAKQGHLTTIVVGERCRRVTVASVRAYIARRLEEAA
jgi:excisionase family DNA binding protein